MLVINFPTADNFLKYHSTIHNNRYEDDEYYKKQMKGRYGETGYLYNIHSPINLESGDEEETYVGTIKKLATYEELEKR